MADKAHSAIFSLNSRVSLPLDDKSNREDKILFQDSDFMQAYTKLNSNDFEQYYKTELKLLLELENAL